MKISAAQEELRATLNAFVNPWRKLTIAVDGIPGVGKSTLGRYLAWQLEIPLVETDLFRIMEEEPPAYRYSELAEVIRSRHELDRPIIIEGVFALHILNALGIEPDYLAYVENTEADEGLRYKEALDRYLVEFSPKEKADYVLDSESLVGM